MNSSLTRGWNRRDWLKQQTYAIVVASTISTGTSSKVRNAIATTRSKSRASAAGTSAGTSHCATHAERIDPASAQALAQRAVDAARAAGATYADARLTRIVWHSYRMSVDGSFDGRFEVDDETLGVGVRALVNGYWGFAASPYWEPDEVVQLAHDAVAQAKDNMLGTPRVVDLGVVPTVTGHWETPVTIDPFTVSIEEKLDFIKYLQQEAVLAGVKFANAGQLSAMQFARQERVIANSEGTLLTQTLYESGANIVIDSGNLSAGGPIALVQRIDTAGQGWERLRDANIPEQFVQIAEDLRRQSATANFRKAADVGRYTLVCDGATMGALVNRTWGLATQLDRALGYEANAAGTSILTDPLAMLGQLQVAGSPVTITANRSAPTQLATVKWDDEGVIPASFSLIENGLLVDFQTTREQAAWLTPYYQRQKKTIYSRGCAAAESGLTITMQHMPNLALEPSSTDSTVTEMISSVTKGILVENGSVETDFQVAGGTLWGRMREITNGRLGRSLTGGAIFFNTLEFWKNITAVGGKSTRVVQAESQYGLSNEGIASYKGQPGQATSHSYSGVAATILNQPLINPARKR